MVSQDFMCSIAWLKMHQQFSEHFCFPNHSLGNYITGILLFTPNLLLRVFLHEGGSFCVD